MSPSALRADVSAPASSSRTTHRRNPRAAAQCSGVRSPSMSIALTSWPVRRKASTCFGWLRATRTEIAVVSASLNIFESLCRVWLDVPVTFMKKFVRGAGSARGICSGNAAAPAGKRLAKMQLVSSRRPPRILTALAMIASASSCELICPLVFLYTTIAICSTSWNESHTPSDATTTDAPSRGKRMDFTVGVEQI